MERTDRGHLVLATSFQDSTKYEECAKTPFSLPSFRETKGSSPQMECLPGCWQVQAFVMDGTLYHRQ